MSDTAQRYDVVIVGGGAAGLMCAIECGRRGRRVIVLEGSNRVGKKILMSGGGRCNFTNLHCEPGRFLSANPHFCKSALARYTQWDFIALVEQHRIAYHEKELGQLFCDQSSKQIVAMLLDECAAAGVTIEVRSGIESISFDEGRYQVTSRVGMIQAESLVVASGGLSIPKMGASGFGYELARQFGLEVLPTRAGLVPFEFRDRDLRRYDGLSGLSLSSVSAKVKSQSFDAGLLFTHRGLSGPAMLQVSSYWQPGDPVDVNLLPDTDIADWLVERKATRPDAELRSVLAERLPRRLVLRLVDLAFTNGPMRSFRDRDLETIAARLSAWTFRPESTEGYRTAEVTLGGVSTEELSSTSMEARRQPRLYFIGEVVDVTGHLGGFNFQWAWSSGWAAGQVA